MVGLLFGALQQIFLKEDGKAVKGDEIRIQTLKVRGEIKRLL